MGNNSQNLDDQIQHSVENSTNWIDNLVNDIHSGAVNNQNYVAGSPEYQQRLNERAALQAQRQQQLQERTKIKEAMTKKFGKVPTSTNLFRSLVGGFEILFTFAFISAGFSDLFVDPGDCIFEFSIGALLGFFGVRKFMKNARYKRYEKYVNIIGMQDLVSIAELESVTGYSHSKVVKDIKGMIGAGVLKQAHIDPKEEWLMLTNEEYQNYQVNQSYNAEKAVQQMREQEEKSKAAKERGEKDPEVVEALNQGADYIRKIRTANDQIPGEEISRKIDRLEKVTAQIFMAVDNHPEKLPEIRKFMDYYMPTTLKLLNSYHEFDIQPVQGDNIVKAKQEIEDTLDMINMAFENLSDRLYEADTMDVSADISVLKTLLAQEGLKGDDFKLQ